MKNIPNLGGKITCSIFLFALNFRNHIYQCWSINKNEEDFFKYVCINLFIFGWTSPINIYSRITETQIPVRNSFMAVALKSKIFSSYSNTWCKFLFDTINIQYNLMQNNPWKASFSRKLFDLIVLQLNKPNYLKETMGRYG